MELFTSELYRIFLGDKSLLFLLEVAFRTTFIFAYTLLLLRFLGKRGMGQLTPFEFAIIVALGSAVGDPMFYGDVPLLHVMLVIAIVVGLHQVLTLLIRSNVRVEKFFEGQSQMLVERGCIDHEQLGNERMSKGELFELLRSEGVAHLGQVRQAFLEPSGILSVIRWEPPRAGLSVLPDGNLNRRFDQEFDAHTKCCSECGAVEGSPPPIRCAKCDCDSWVAAVAGRTARKPIE